MDYHRSVKQVAQPKPSKADMKWKIGWGKQSPNLNKWIKNYNSIFSKITSGVPFLWKGHCCLKGIRKKCKQTNKKVSHNILSWKLKYFCLKCPVHQSAPPRSSSEHLDQSCLKPRISIHIFQVWTWIFHERKKHFVGICSEKSFAVEWYLIYLWVPCFSIIVLAMFYE